MAPLLSLNLSEDVDDVVDDGRRLLTLWKRNPSSRGAVEVVDEVLEAPRRSHKGLVAAVSQLIPKGPRALGGRCLLCTRVVSCENDAVGGLLDDLQKVGEKTCNSSL